MDNSLNEESLRQFVEECDNFQGFQASFDNSSFGGFAVSLFESIRDEFAKIPVLAFPVLSGVDPSRLDIGDDVMRKAVLQDAACICALDELATQSIPTKSPSSWKLEGGLKRLKLDTSSVYQTSAVLSSHIESATLPLRMKGGNEGLSDICSQLNWAQNTRFSHLSGALPVTDGEPIGDSIYDFSLVVEPNVKKRDTIVQRNVSRGLNIDRARSMEAHFNSSTKLDSPYLSSVHAPAYPLPTSFPSIILPPSVQASKKPAASAGPTLGRPKDITLLSTLRTTSASIDALRAYAKVVHACVVRRYTEDDAAGLDGDEIKEMKERLEVLAEAYAGDDENGEVDGYVGEDEDVE